MIYVKGAPERVLVRCAAQQRGLAGESRIDPALLASPGRAACSTGPARSGIGDQVAGSGRTGSSFDAGRDGLTLLGLVG